MSTTAPKAKILITDCDHDSISVEEDLATTHGIELVRASCTSEEDVIAAGVDADALLVQYAPITERVMSALPRLRVIGRYGVGVDTIDVPAATAHGIAVCNVPDYATEEVSDHAIALTLSLARGITGLDRSIRTGNHTLTPVTPLHRIAGRVFGVIGLGLIGSATARKARGLGYSVIGFDPLHQPGSVTEDGVQVATFEHVIRHADVLSLHVPLNSRTRHLINAEVLTQTKDGAILINTCRGAVVDTAALVEALSNGRLQAAGLDVFEEEPLPAGSALLQLDNVALTPHAAWYSEESHTDLKRRLFENVLQGLVSGRPGNPINPDVFHGQVQRNQQH
ncbi:MAG: 2-hydroxyacid dehydrogenase [Micrococcaceae bacterium]|nr:2-hydroxyacid dehydrogenase [Micrococcaceae bacterium]